MGSNSTPFQVYKYRIYEKEQKNNCQGPGDKYCSK